MKKAVEVVKVDPQCMIVECNRIMDIIDNKRDTLFEEELMKVMGFFRLNLNEAEEFTHQMTPKNSIMYKYGEDEYVLALKYLTKCIDSLDKPNIKMNILRTDYKTIVEYG
jgi:hypothetical protein